MNPFYYLAFLAIPIIVSKFKNDTCIIAMSWGLIVAPLSTSLYALFFIPYIGIIFIPFLPISIFLNKPAWWILVEKTGIINGQNMTILNELLLIITNGIFWGAVFYSTACIVKKL